VNGKATSATSSYIMNNLQGSQFLLLNPGSIVYLQAVREQAFYQYGVEACWPRWVQLHPVIGVGVQDGGECRLCGDTQGLGDTDLKRMRFLCSRFTDFNQTAIKTLSITFPVAVNILNNKTVYLERS